MLQSKKHLPPFIGRSNNRAGRTATFMYTVFNTMAKSPANPCTGGRQRVVEVDWPKRSAKWPARGGGPVLREL